MNKGNIEMKIGIISAAVVALAVAVASAPAMASGSGSGSRGGGGFGGVSGSSSVSSADQLIRRGRSQVRRRITCSDCKYHDRLNDQTAAEVAQAVRNGEFEIKERDRTAVLTYLRDRYGV